MKLLAYLAGLIAGFCGYKIKPANPPKDGGNSGGKAQAQRGGGSGEER